MATAGKALQNCHARFPCWATAATALTRQKGRIAGGRGVFLHDYGRCCHSHEANVRRLWYDGVSTAHSVQRQPYSPHRGISNGHGRHGTAKLPCTIPMLGHCCHRLWYDGVSTAHSVQRQPYSPHRGISNGHGRHGTAKLPCTIPMLGHCCHSTDTAERANRRRPRSLPSYRAMAVAAAAMKPT